MAGALGVQLGGVNYYGGRRAERPILGDAEGALSLRHVDRAVVVMTVAYLLAIAGSVRFLWH